MNQKKNSHSTSNPNQFLKIDYETLAVNTIQHNGKSHKFTSNHKLAYSYLAGWQNNGKDVFPSYNKMAEVFGVTSKTIEKWITALEKMGLITKTNREGESNLYAVFPINNSSGRSYSENKGTRHEKQQATSENFPSTIDIADIDDPFPISEKSKESASYSEYLDYHHYLDSDYNNEEDYIDDFLASCE